MLKGAKLTKGIIVTVANKIGVLADMSKTLADHGINIEAVKGYAENQKAKIMLITDDNLRSIDALKKSGYKSAVESEMIMLELENNPGALNSITAKLASEEIDINFIYGTTCPSSCPARIILSTSDDEKALVALKAK